MTSTSSSPPSSTFAAWFAPASHDERLAVDLVRVAVAVLLFVHPAHALLEPGDVGDLARGLEARGLPLALGLAWAALLVQALAATALVIPRFILPGALASFAVVAGGAALLYAPRWYVVGGLEVDGHPGIEFNVLLLACLSAVLWTHWPRRAGEAAGRSAAKVGLEIIRVASALSLLAHGVGPLVDVAGMHEWGEAMSQSGWPYGVALVWTVKGIELVSSVLRLSRRLVVPACFGHLSYLLPGLWISHRQHWFVVGPAENGLEFPVLIILCTAACIVGYWPRAATTQGAGTVTLA